MDFVHLHVASSFSLRYGTSTPRALVERAASHGQGALALTDRDGVYGAVRFVRACQEAGIAPVLGADLAVDPAVDDADASRVGGRDPGRDVPVRGGAADRFDGKTRQPVRGGMEVDPRLPRVTVLARGAGAGLGPGVGWARLCRLVTVTHLRGERGRPVASRSVIAEHAGGAPAPLLVLLGPDSDVGRAVLAGRRDLARARLARWAALLPPDALVVEIVNHGGPPGTPRCAGQAGRMLTLAAEAGLRTVATAAVRHADPQDAATADVLDAARRLVLLQERHLDRVSTAGHLAPARTVYAAALRVTGEATGARALLRAAVDLARECLQDPRADIGIGAVHLPEAHVLGLGPGERPQAVLARRCRGAIGQRYPGASRSQLEAVTDRLDDELAVVAALGYPTYFLTVAAVCDLVRGMGIRVAARGSGAGSLVNHLLGISGVDPMRYGLLMERFCTPLRAQLPDIDLDVESARRTEVYERILDRFGGERVTCVSMIQTYRVRHAIRDVGSALGLPPAEIDGIAKAFPHIRARDARAAIAELPELSTLRRSAAGLEVLFDLVERLDGLPRHVALHPCGIVLSNAGLLDRTPVEASRLGFPMSQFDKDDVEVLGLLKLDVLGIRMQSAMAHAVTEIERVEGVRVDLDDREQVPLDDEATFDLVRSTRTLGCFQIESPGQRELVGKFAPATFEDLVIDISLFRPGPVKSDMIIPFLAARQGWAEPDVIHPALADALDETCGVVVFHEQVLRIVAITTGICLAEADEVRRALGTIEGREEVERWWRPRAAARGYRPADADRIWEVLAAFASFGFCKAHAAAFALPTYQSAWLKTHHPAAFLAGVLTHDPGMYPKRLILDDARQFGVAVLGLDVNASGDAYRIERLEDGGRGIRLALADVKGMSAEELARIVTGRPYAGLDDFWRRAQASRPVTERLVLAGAFDSLYGIDVAGGAGLGRRGGLTRRDLLLHVGELDRWSRARSPATGLHPYRGAGTRPATDDVRACAAAQSQAAAPVVAAERRPAQLLLDLAPLPAPRASLPEMTRDERVRAELEILGLDVTGHVMHPYADLLDELGVVRAADLRGVRSRSDILVAGVKVATQTPPVRSGRRVIFCTLDDATGPLDVTFFDDVQGDCAATVFHSWFLLVRGVLRRTGPMGVSMRATGAWELSGLAQEHHRGGIEAVRRFLTAGPRDRSGGRGARRVLVHPSGFRQSPYADTRPPGAAVAGVGRKLWHASPGSPGR